MARTRNPLGDPVRIQKKGSKWGIRYYPTGLVGDPSERVWLNEYWPLDSPMSDVEAAAASLRETLISHRSSFGAGGADDVPTVTVAKSVEAFVASLRETNDDDESGPEGTARTRQSQLRYNLTRTHGHLPITELRAHADVIVEAIDTTPARGKTRPRGATARSNIAGALSVYGTWFATTYRLPNPFAQALADREANSPTAKRAKAIRMVQREDPFEDPLDDDGRIEPLDPCRVPDPQDVVQLQNAIFRRETDGDPSRPTAGRGSRGGAKPLDAPTAWQLAGSAPFTAASGARGCEMLAAHTSRIRVGDGIVRIDRQLDRYAPWRPGEPPPLAPTKHLIVRDAQFWPEFLPRLQQLVDHADEYNDGWLFYPSRGQKWWADGFGNMLGRARELMRWEHEHHSDQEASKSPLRTFRFHDLRHFYASHSLASVDNGGMGWSLHFVSKSLGHRSQETTEKIYRHIISGEWAAARNSRHSVLAVDDILEMPR